eukprot:scaffold8630_cov60-Phaeocystis_antarctica.AAC.2
MELHPSRLEVPATIGSLGFLPPIGRSAKVREPDPQAGRHLGQSQAAGMGRSDPGFARRDSRLGTPPAPGG